MPQSTHPTFGGNSFETKAAAIGHFRMILRRYPLRTRVGEQDAAALYDLLRYHPELVTKLKGRTVTHFEVHPNKGGRSCFYLVRDDGSWIDFSMHKCLDRAYASARQRRSA